VPLDFTFAAFDLFCQRISHMPVFTVAAFLARAAPPPTPFIILRLDVDYREEHAVHMSRIADRYHVQGSFYFRRRERGFNWQAIRAVASLDHEVGYHFETLDRSRGDVERARSLFLKDVEALRRAGCLVRTVAAHGAPPTAPTYRGNLDLVSGAPRLLDKAGLLGETTLSMDFTRVAYLSDATWRWRRYDYYRPGQHGKPTSLRAILDDLTRRDAGLYITFHPHQWFPHPAQALVFRARHRIARQLVPPITD
jgi:hypothetical protein